MKVALAQVNPTIGDFDSNVRLILDAASRAAEAGATVLVTPELAVCGYPPRDLLERRDFVEANLRALDALSAQAPEGMTLVVGFVDQLGPDHQPGLANAAAVVEGGVVRSVHHKRLLPTYDVFDEDRYFSPAESLTLAEIGGHRVAITICEDAWSDRAFWGTPRYAEDPVEVLVREGAELLLNLSASPFHAAKQDAREGMLRALAKRHRIPVLYCNQIGGNDELLFDGHSVYVDPFGEVRARGAAFAEDLVLCDLDAPECSTPLVARVEPTEEAVRQALVLGLRDYVRKCGFSDVLLGLSGGIDSALVCALAVEALGAEHVLGVAMPSRYSSDGSVSDAHALGEALGIRMLDLPIEGPFAAFEGALTDAFAGREPDVTEENLQARIRGTLLMALSNKFGALVLTTGNKSELAVGYCTLYGDMNGGLAVISDLPKTLVYRVARQINEVAGRPIIPESTLTKPPSAELRPDQVDEDSLPPYDVLDNILDRYVVQMHAPDDIVASGHDLETVRRIVGLVDRNEYKRRQAAPGLRVTTKAFGSGRRMPIAAKGSWYR